MLAEVGPTDVNGLLDCGDPRAALSALILDLSELLDEDASGFLDQALRS